MNLFVNNYFRNTDQNNGKRFLGRIFVLIGCGIGGAEDTMEALNEDGTLKIETILLIEQNATVVLEISDRGYVIETGKIVAIGTAQELLASDEVQKAYLGG